LFSSLNFSFDGICPWTFGLKSLGVLWEFERGRVFWGFAKRKFGMKLYKRCFYKEGLPERGIWLGRLWKFWLL
jgi:hypothetical protein